MSKPSLFRLGNSLLLGLIALMGAVFFQSTSAHGDAFGTSCPPNWARTNGMCNANIYFADTNSSTCASDYSGRQCCTYEGFKVQCMTFPMYDMGYAYKLKHAGQDGSCPSGGGQCVLII